MKSGKKKDPKIFEDCPFGFSETNCRNCQMYLDGDCLQEASLEDMEGDFDDDV